ncbi:MAG: molybdopterin-dependent oxidoreductase [Ornithinibacter sp.]
MSERSLTGLAARIDELVPSPESFDSGLRGPRTTARVGTWLGVAFAICFVTGLYSHASQLATPPVPLPASPARLYQLTQGLHVASGTAAIPLLLVKLWSVFPRFFIRPPRAPRTLVLHVLERVSIALLLGGAIFQLVTGLANSAQWYPWSFDFIRTHYAVAWITIGALVIHIGVKLPIIRAAITGPVDDPMPEGVGDESDQAASESPSRRTLLHATWVSAAIAVVVATSNEIPGLRRLGVLAVRSGDGPQGVPVNRSAVGALVADLLDDPAWRLKVIGPGGTTELSLDDLRAMPQHEAVLPIACVEGWSATGTWSGIPIRDIVRLAGGSEGSVVVVRSMQPRGAYRESRLPANFARHPDSLLALTLSGEPLAPDHGYPARLIAPARPGVTQTKWVNEIEVAE